jgi:hypothetical protein
MSTKKALALTGLLLILGAGLALAQEQKQAAVTERAKNRVQVNWQDRTQNRMRFQDQNGDGINDFRRDYDNDGIPNCQDPDWTRPEDGNGYQNRNGQGGSSPNPSLEAARASPVALPGRSLPSAASRKASAAECVTEQAPRG